MLCGVGMCPICGTAIVIVTLDTAVATLGFFVSMVLKGAQGFVSAPLQTPFCLAARLTVLR